MHVFSYSGTLKKGVGCAECVRPVSSRMQSGHVHSWLHAANSWLHCSISSNARHNKKTIKQARKAASKRVRQCYETYDIPYTSACNHSPTFPSIRLCIFLKCHPYPMNCKDRLRITLRITAKTNEILRIVRIVIYGFRNYKPIITILTILNISLVFTMILKMILKHPYVRIEMSRTG